MGIVERAVELAQEGEKGAPSAPSPSESLNPGYGVPTGNQRPSAARGDFGKTIPDRASLTATDLKPIVQIDPVRLRALGRLPPEGSARRTEEEMRRIKWQLLNAINGRDALARVRNNVILVTSALPSEGKTFVSLNLALSLVRDREMRVILVDGDVARPGLTPALGLDGRPGLTDVLEDPGLSISAVTYQTDVDGLMVVPAGKPHDRAPEFFAGSRMPVIIEDLIARSGHGVVILDSPPLLATNEAQVVTRYVGQVVLVVRANQTQQRAVHDAIALIDQSGTISAVLNGSSPSALGSYYGDYGYGAGYGDESRAVRRNEQTEGHADV
jgi:exopolysaccharide/PEP-CTERM locus tyrosine autokinase